MYNMDLLFKAILSNVDDLFKYLSYEDHKKLSIAFMDEYIGFLYSRDETILKKVLESINIHQLHPTTLNTFHRGIWNHISLNCKLREKFIYRWSHKINMLRLRINNNCRNFDKHGNLLPRKFSEKFISIFPGMLEYKPCNYCFDDLSYHYKEWFCDNCKKYPLSDSANVIMEFFTPLWSDSDRHWSDDDSDYDTNDDDEYDYDNNLNDIVDHIMNRN